MSGETNTYVSLRQSEYRRMMDACRRLDNLDTQVRVNLERSSGVLRRDMENRIAAMQQRYDRYDSQLSGISEQIQGIERKQNERLRQQAQEFQRGIETLGREIQSQRREYISLIQEQEERLSKAMEEQRHNLQKQISSLQAHLAQKEKGERARAEQWSADTKRCIDLLDQEYRHEKFKPGALDNLRNQLLLNETNLQDKDYQAAKGIAQDAYRRAQELRMELERLELEWNAYLAAARQSSAEVVATCNAQDSCCFSFETEEGAVEVAGKVDYWTEGALSDLREQAEAELKRLDTPDALSTEELKQSLIQSQAWRQQCLALTEQAKEALIASQLRNNIAQTIEASLALAGWTVTDSTYEGKDYRRALHVKLKSTSDDEIVTIISPEYGPENTIENKINVSFFDRSTNDEQFRLQRMDTITNQLRRDGLQCTQPQCVPGTENQPAQDEEKLKFERIRQAKPIVQASR